MTDTSGLAGLNIPMHKALDAVRRYGHAQCDLGIAQVFYAQARKGTDTAEQDRAHRALEDAHSAVADAYVAVVDAIAPGGKFAG